MHIIYITRSCGYSSFILRRWIWSYLSHWRVAGAGANWSILSRCFSRLIFLISSPSWTVYRRLQSLPTGAVWLGCLNLGAWLGIFVYTYVHTSLQGGLLYIHSKKGDTHIHVINHTDHTIGEGLLDLLFPTPSVGHDRVKHSLNG
jgi:hypothetical protein